MANWRVLEALCHEAGVDPQSTGLHALRSGGWKPLSSPTRPNSPTRKHIVRFAIL